MSLASLLAALVLMGFSGLFLMAVLAAVWFFDRYDREPLPLVVAVLLWGAVPAPFLAVLGETMLRGLLGMVLDGPRLTMAVTALGAPLVEEALKGLAILGVMLFSDQFDNPTDGVVYGTAVALGFAVSENLLYSLGAVADSPHAVGQLVLIRTLTSAGVHAVASSLFGGALGVAYLSRRWWSRVLVAGAGFLGAAVIHGGWNAAAASFTLHGDPTPLASALLALPLVYLLYVAVLAAFLGWEHRLLVRQLGEEVELGVLPPWVVEVIPSYRRRIRPDWWPSRRERTVIARLLTRLAFRKHAIAHLPPDEARLAGLEVMRLRERARRILLPSEDQTAREEPEE